MYRSCKINTKCVNMRRVGRNSLNISYLIGFRAILFGVSKKKEGAHCVGTFHSR